MPSGGQTVSNFVKSAFPSGTVPFASTGFDDTGKPNDLGSDAAKTSQKKLFWQDYSFNRPQFKIEGHEFQHVNKGHIPLEPTTWLDSNGEIDWEKEPFPIWPPDMFGATSLLIERSTIYQYLRPPMPSQDLTSKLEDFNYRKSVMAPFLKDFTRTEMEIKEDPFQVYEAHQFALRLAGSIWGSGALNLSGLSLVDNGKVRHPTTKELGRINGEQAKKAILFVRERYNQEVTVDSVDEFVNYICRLVIRGWSKSTHPPVDSLFDWGLPVGDGLPTLQGLVERLDAYPLWSPRLAAEEIHKICQHTDPDNVYSSFLARREELQPLALIMWATLFIQYEWQELLKAQESIQSRDHHRPGTAWPKWCGAAIRLHILADEACKGIGLSGRGFGDYNQGKDGDGSTMVGPLRAGLSCKTMWDHYSHNRLSNPDSAPLTPPRTLARCFNDDLGSLLPKARTPNSGCTIRSLSHNVCILPPRARVRARWHRQPERAESNTFNVLLVPYPYRIKSKHVEAKGYSGGSKGGGNRNREGMGSFAINPIWIYEDISHKNGRSEKPEDPNERERYHNLVWEFLKSLLDDQAEGTVDAIVFPEASLDWETFNYLAGQLVDYQTKNAKDVRARKPTLEIENIRSLSILVAGITGAPGMLLSHIGAGDKEVPGNFVATYTGQLKEGSNRCPCYTWTSQHVRAKHHRWRMEKSQLKSYALSNRLDPNIVWWEHIDLPPREMLFAEFTPGSVLTTLICEDLARIEPCQVALRAVGPNLIFVLLMDSAQIVARWPYQYAGVLSDDPGSSVLTLTSFGLIRRSSLSEEHKSRSIAVWREPLSGRPEMIELPVGFHAQLVTLRREHVLERTLDGRGDNGDSAAIWRLAGKTPIKATSPPPGGDADHDWFPEAASPKK
jgi:hypothetical protein